MIVAGPRGRVQRAAVLFAVLGVLTACAVGPDVVTERADTLESSVPPDDQVGGGSAPPTSLSWGPCDPFGAPGADLLGTTAWQCATLVVPMDPFGRSEGLEPVELALTRHPATGDRRGSVLVNPGGPGASGLDLVWSLRSSYPSDMLRAFDIVSWDPRGVGRSTPAIRCGAADVADEALMEACARATGDLAAHVAAPYSAEDMEAIREALGEDTLHYLGYSYGTLLGAEYAARHPDRVGRFVLDGAIDPDVGGPDTVFEDGFPYYSVDGVAAAADRFEELCDATSRCDLGDDTESALDELRRSVDDLPTAYLDVGPDEVTGEMFGDVMRAAFGYAGDWELVGTALADARQGDASALAALVAFGPEVGDEDGDGQSFDLANLVIYCADFGPSITEWSYCDAIPRNAEPMRPVAPVDVETPILVIGTTFDPATPGVNAPEFAAALGDAVHVVWDGVGHTAFPAPTPCIDTLVVDYLVGTATPADGTVCAFYDGITDDAELAAVLFGHGDSESLQLLQAALEFGLGVGGAEARCAAGELNLLADQVISHVVLGVDSPDARERLDEALGRC